MGKIALLVSREEMLYQTHNILQERQYGISEMRVIKTGQSVIEARSSIANGASIIIARGLQASLIKQYTDIPVVEIVITAQEMALLVIKAKQIIGKENPVIAVVGFKNMFCDMSYFDGIYDIELRTYYSDHGDGLETAAGQAVAEGADLVIGGDTAVEVATRMGVPSLFLSITEDSLRAAFSMAETMDYAMEIEKRNAAQMETLLDYSFSGVVKVDGDGMITAVNPTMEEIIGIGKEELAGRRLTDVFEDLEPDRVTDVLVKGSEAYSNFMQLKNTAVFGILAPVVIQGNVDGAILSCHKVKRFHQEKEKRKDSRGCDGLVAMGHFRDIRQLSQPMQECVHVCRIFSGSDKPVLLAGEAGTEMRLLAQAIHNNSLEKEGPFVSVDLYGLTSQQQEETVFGPKGAVYLAQQGTLFLESVQELSQRSQALLYQLLRQHTLPGASLRPVPMRVRLILAGTVGRDGVLLAALFREDLWYLLGMLSVQVPALRRRKEDLEQSIKDFIKYYCDKYSHYHSLTNGGLQAMLSYPWYGNLVQLEGFCERLILLAGKRNIDEVMVNQMLRNLYPEDSGREADGQWKLSDNREDVYRAWAGCEEAEQIRASLQKHGGSREKAALELGISKATLWRKMKKYEIM